MPMKPSNPNENMWQTALAISGMGATLVAYILLGLFAGYGLARLWDGPRMWMGLGAIIGMILGIANIVWLVRKFIGGTK